MECGSHHPQKSNYRISYLDGLRGWAAAAVVLFHAFCDFMSATPFASAILPLCLPFNGPLAVRVFFVISGFALTAPFLASGDTRVLLRMAASRYFRLAIPIFAACAIAHVSMVTGFILPAAERPGLFRHSLAFDPSLEHLISFSFFDVFFSYEGHQSYVTPLWTMPFELSGSLFVLGTIFMLRRCRWRLPICLIGTVYLLWIGNAYSLFFAGVVMADGLRLWSPDIRTGQTIGLALIAVGALAPLYYGLNLQIYHISAILICFGCGLMPLVRIFLSNAFSQWLGRISFPLYLVHGSVLFAIGPRFVLAESALGLPHVAHWLLMSATIVLLSFAGAILFTPVNEWAISSSRRIGGFVLSFVMVLTQMGGALIVAIEEAQLAIAMKRPPLGNRGEKGSPIPAPKLPSPI